MATVRSGEDRSFTIPHQGVPVLAIGMRRSQR
jgi:hypothetical protein